MKIQKDGNKTKFLGYKLVWGRGGGEIGILNEIYMKRQREKNLNIWVIEQTGVQTRVSSWQYL
jgi:hypothetical protein